MLRERREGVRLEHASGVVVVGVHQLAFWLVVVGASSVVKGSASYARARRCMVGLSFVALTPDLDRKLPIVASMAALGSPACNWRVRVAT
jgi:hypothetical protein